VDVNDSFVIDVHEKIGTGVESGASVTVWTIGAYAAEGDDAPIQTGDRQ
jgi:hypothetical protein